MFSDRAEGWPSPGQLCVISLIHSILSYRFFTLLVRDWPWFGGRVRSGANSSMSSFYFIIVYFLVMGPPIWGSPEYIQLMSSFVNPFVQGAPWMLRTRTWVVLILKPGLCNIWEKVGGDFRCLPPSRESNLILSSYFNLELVIFHFGSLKDYIYKIYWANGQLHKALKASLALEVMFAFEAKPTGEIDLKMSR